MTQSNFRQIDGKWMPRITNVLKIIDKGVGFHKWLLSKTPEEVDQILEDTGESGTRIHAGCVALATKGKIKTIEYANNLTEYKKLRGFANWIEDYKPIFIDFEKVVDDGKVCGQYDILCAIKGIAYIVDIKTGKGIYPTYNTQVCFYSYCASPDEKDHEYKPAILHLKDTDKGYLFKDNIDLAEGIKDYKAVYRLYKSYGYPMEPPEEEEIPCELIAEIGEKNAK